MNNLLLFFLLTISLVYSQKNMIDSNGLKQGYWELHFPKTDSLVSEKGFFVNDKEDGFWVRFHDIGIVREIINYKNGLVNGTRVLIDNRGKLQEQESFVNDKFDGVQKYFHDTGKLKMQISYKNGVIDGEMIKYYRNGKKQEKSIYLNGLKEGKSSWYYENESISIE